MAIGINERDVSTTFLAMNDVQRLFVYSSDLPNSI
jgi:hypothetical protein